MYSVPLVPFSSLTGSQIWTVYLMIVWRLVKPPYSEWGWGMFHSAKSLAVTRNRGYYYNLKFERFWIWSNIHDKNVIFKGSKSELIFFSNFSGCRAMSNFTIFQQIKVLKHIWDQGCHLVTGTDSWSIQIHDAYWY